MSLQMGQSTPKRGELGLGAGKRVEEPTRLGDWCVPRLVRSGTGIKNSSRGLMTDSQSYATHDTTSRLPVLHCTLA
jgi:hypothetical protein